MFVPLTPKGMQTVKEYADSQSITVQAVYKRIKAKTIKFRKVGSVYLISEPVKREILTT